MSLSKQKIMVILHIYTDDGVIDHCIEESNNEKTIERAVKFVKNIYKKGYRHTSGVDLFEYSKNEIKRISWELI